MRRRRTPCRVARGEQQNLPPGARGPATAAAFRPRARGFLPASQKGGARLHGWEDGRSRAASARPNAERETAEARRKKPASPKAVLGKPASNQFPEDACESMDITLRAAFVSAKSNRPSRKKTSAPRVQSHRVSGPLACIAAETFLERSLPAL